MSHPRELLTVVRDPSLERGPFKVYLRTDGRACVVDRRLWETPAWASASVAVRDRVEDASDAMDVLAQAEGF